MTKSEIAFHLIMFGIVIAAIGSVGYAAYQLVTIIFK